MKAEIKRELTEVVKSSLTNYSYLSADDKADGIRRLEKELNLLKEIEAQDIENSIKKKRLKLDIQKYELEVVKVDLENLRISLERDKYESDKLRTQITNEIENERLRLEQEKLDFEREKLNLEFKKSRADKIFNGLIKGIEVGIPLVVNTGLTLMLFRLIYKDDGRAPSEMKDLMRHVYRK